MTEKWKLQHCSSRSLSLSSSASFPLSGPDKEHPTVSSMRQWRTHQPRQCRVSSVTLWRTQQLEKNNTGLVAYFVVLHSVRADQEEVLLFVSPCKGILPAWLTRDGKLLCNLFHLSCRARRLPTFSSNVVAPEFRLQPFHVTQSAPIVRCVLHELHLLFAMLLVLSATCSSSVSRCTVSKAFNFKSGEKSYSSSTSPLELTTESRVNFDRHDRLFKSAATSFQFSSLISLAEQFLRWCGK